MLRQHLSLVSSEKIFDGLPVIRQHRASTSAASTSAQASAERCGKARFRQMMYP